MAHPAVVFLFLERWPAGICTLACPKRTAALRAANHRRRSPAWWSPSCWPCRCRHGQHGMAWQQAFSRGAAALASIHRRRLWPWAPEGGLCVYPTISLSCWCTWRDATQAATNICIAELHACSPPHASPAVWVGSWGSAPDPSLFVPASKLAPCVWTPAPFPIAAAPARHPLNKGWPSRVFSRQGPGPFRIALHADPHSGRAPRALMSLDSRAGRAPNSGIWRAEPILPIIASLAARVDLAAGVGVSCAS